MQAKPAPPLIRQHRQRVGAGVRAHQIQCAVAVDVRRHKATRSDAHRDRGAAAKEAAAIVGQHGHGVVSFVGADQVRFAIAIDIRRHHSRRSESHGQRGVGAETATPVVGQHRQGVVPPAWLAGKPPTKSVVRADQIQAAIAVHVRGGNTVRSAVFIAHGKRTCDKGDGGRRGGSSGVYDPERWHHCAFLARIAVGFVVAVGFVPVGGRVVPTRHEGHGMIQQVVRVRPIVGADEPDSDTGFRNRWQDGHRNRTGLGVRVPGDCAFGPVVVRHPPDGGVMQIPAVNARKLQRQFRGEHRRSVRDGTEIKLQ